MAPGEALYGVDVESLTGDFGAHQGYVARGEPSAQQCDNPSVFALTAYPRFVFLTGNGVEANFHTEVVGFEKQVLEHIAAFGRGGLHENAKR